MVKRYSDGEVSLLRKYNSNGLGPRQISDLFPERSYISIKSKLSHLGLKMETNYQPNPHEELPDMSDKVLKLLKRQKYGIIELADTLDVGPRTIRESLNYLEDNGYNIQYDDDVVDLNRKSSMPKKPFKIDIKKFFGKRIKFGALADTHLGSKHERLDILNSLYDIYEREGVSIVLHGGNWVDGEFYHNKHEVYTKGFDEMIDNFLEKYPQRKGIETWFVDGDDHEGWWMQREGIEPGRVLEDRAKQMGRNDLKYLGYMERDLILKTKNGQATLRLMHAGGGSSYAHSYATQKIVESYGEGEKPHILLVGHLHKAIYHLVRGVHVVQLGTTQDQTRFMRKRKLKAHLGGWIIELNQADTGEITRFKPEFIPYYNKGFYDPMIKREPSQQPIKLEDRL